MSGNLATAPPYVLSNFSLRHMADCGALLRTLGKKAANMEEAAQRIVRHLHDRLLDQLRRR